MSLPAVLAVMRPPLPNELLASIVRYATKDTKSLLQLRAVNSGLQQLADRELFADVRLSTDMARGEKVEGIQAPRIAQWVRSLALYIWDSAPSHQDIATLDQYTRLFANLETFPRLKSLKFVSLSGSDRQALHFQAAFASLGNSCTTQSTPLKVPALSIVGVSIPPAACFTNLPPIVFSQLTELKVTVLSDTSRSIRDHDAALWDVFTNRILCPTQPSLTTLYLSSFLGWPLEDHPDLVFPQLRSLGLGNALLGTVKRHTESFILRHPTLQNLRLADCPLIIYAKGAGSAHLWAPLWDALREGLPVLQSIVLRRTNEGINLHDGIARDDLEYYLQYCRKDSERLYTMGHVQDDDWQAADRLSRVLQERRSGKS